MIKGFWGSIETRVKSLTSNNYRPGSSGSSATSLSIIGYSGIGKSTAIQAILLLYPQILIHHQYQGRNFTHVQIVWLKIDCPSNGSLKSLCLNFIQAVDDLIGENYYAHFNCGRKTAEALMPIMARIASLHTIGVLAIDEIQNLNEASSGGYKRMLNFFVELINTIGLPVVLIGTPAAQGILSSELRQARRGSSPGDCVWDPMANDDTWELFSKMLWKYQYVQNPCSLTKPLMNALYEESQGIVDFAVKLFVLTQIRAITTTEEKITKGLIHSVAKDSLRLARKFLNALKSKDYKEIQKYSDIRPIDIEPYIQKAQTTTNDTDLTIDIDQKLNEIAPKGSSGTEVQQKPSTVQTGSVDKAKTLDCELNKEETQTPQEQVNRDKKTANSWRLCIK